MPELPLTDACPWCGAPPCLDVFEVWGREFMLETCCEAAHDWITWELEHGTRDPELRALFESYGIPCRQIYPSDGQLLLDHGLTLGSVSAEGARSLIAEHHAHHYAPPPGWKWTHGAYNGPDLVAVAIVGRPVARMIDPATTVEVTRLCARRDLAPALRWNACSMLYGAAAREARRQGYRKIITYTLDHESGESVRAAGWAPEARTRGGSWSRRNRQRQDKHPTGPKVRWARELVPEAQGRLF